MARSTWGGAAEFHPLRVRISFRLGTSLCQTGFVLRDTSLTPSNPQDAADEVADWVNASFRTIFSSADQFLGVDVVDLTTGEGGAVSFANVTGTLPLDAATLLPSYIQVPVSLKGELRRRYGQGRMLWPVRSENWVNENVLSAAGVAALQGVIDAFTARYIGVGGSSDYTLVNVHGVIPPREATPTAPARPQVEPTWYDVTTVRLGTIMSFLRSRQAGKGS